MKKTGSISPASPPWMVGLTADEAPSLGGAKALLAAQSAAPNPTRKLQAFAAAAKAAGIDLAEFLDEKGRLSLEHFPSAKLRALQQAQKFLPKNIDSSVRLFQSALQLEPQDPALRLALAKAYFTRANRAKNPELREIWIREGRQELDAVLRRDPRHVEALRTKALSFGLDPGFLGDDGRIRHPELLPANLRGGELQPAQIFAGLAYQAAISAEAKGPSSRVRALLEAAVEMDPAHALAQTALAGRDLAEGKLRKAKNHLRLALSQAREDAELDKLHCLLAGAEGGKLMPKGEKPWSFLGQALFESGRHDLARSAFLKAAEADPAKHAEWRRWAQLADERERPYEREFATLSAPNPVAASLYEALKRQGVPDEAMDSAKDRRLTQREIFDYIGGHLSDPGVRKALDERGWNIPPGEVETARKLGFGSYMARRLTAEAQSLREGSPASSEVTDKLEQALYFEPDQVERHLALADAYSAEGHESAAVEVLVGAARLSPQNKALSRRLLSSHETALEKNLQAAEKHFGEGRFEEAKSLLARSAEQQESLRGLLNREKPLDGALNPAQVDTCPQLLRLGKSRILFAQILERQGQGGESIKAYGEAAAILEKGLQAETEKEPLENRLDLRRSLHRAADGAGDFEKALDSLRSATRLVSIDIPGEFQPHQDLWDYEQELSKRLGEAHDERIRAQDEIPPEQSRIVSLLQTEKKLNEALGRKVEAQALETFLGEAGARQRLEGMVEQAHRIAAAGNLEEGSLKRCKVGDGLGMLSDYITLGADSEAPSFAFTAAYRSLAPSQQAKVAEALLRSGRRSELSHLAQLEEDPVKKLYYEVKLAQLDGLSRDLRRKADDFLEKSRNHGARDIKDLRREIEGLAARFDAEARVEFGKVSAEVRALLGPLVPSLYQDANGALDMSKVRAAGPGEFKQWLLDQMWIEGRKLSDLAGYSARWRGVFDNYRLVLHSSDFDPLLAALFQEAQGAGETQVFAPGQGLEKLRVLTRELATVSPTQFAAAHLGTKEGRARLRAILEDDKNFDAQLRVDLVRAIARAKSKESAHGLQAYVVGKASSTIDFIVFDLNISNLSVTAKEREQAVRCGVDILSSIDEIEIKTEERRQKYLFHPEKVKALALPEGRRIDGEEIRRLAEIQERNKDRPDPLSQMRAKLAGAWLLAADDGNWAEGGIASTPANRAHLLKNAERLLGKLAAVKNESEFRVLIQELRSFLAAPLPTDSAALKWADDTLKAAQDLPILKALPASTGLGQYLEEDLVGEMSAADREPFDGLKGMADEIWSAVEMGESLSLRVEGLKSEDPKVRSAVENYILGLERAKRGMWAGYKQKHWLYRGLATEGGLLAEDIPNIRAANRAIDGIIEKLKSAENAGDVRRINQELYAMSKAGGVLYKGFSAAATDWTAEISSLGATTLEVIALSAVSAGAGGAARISMRVLNSARQWVRTMRAVSQPLQASKLEASAQAVSRALQTSKSAALRPSRQLFQAFRHSEALRAAGLGAYIASAENIASNVSGQLKVQPDTVLSWLKDAMATGFSMAVVAPLPPHAAATRKNVLQGMWNRYFANPAAGALRFTADTGKEVVEEVLDAYVRQALDGRYQSLSLEEFTDILSVCAFGGAKMGLIKQVIGRGARGIASISQGRVATEEKRGEARLLRGFRERGERVVLDPSRRQFFLVDAEGGLIRKVKRPAVRAFLEFERGRLGEEAQGLPLVLFESVKRGSKGLLLAHSPESLPPPGNQREAKAPASVRTESELATEDAEGGKPAMATLDEPTSPKPVARQDESPPRENETSARPIDTPWSAAEVANDNAQIPEAWRAAVQGETFPLRPGVSPGLSSSVAMASGIAGVVGSATAESQARAHRVKAGETLKVPPAQVTQSVAPAPSPTAKVVPLREKGGVSRTSSANVGTSAAALSARRNAAAPAPAPGPAHANGPASGMVLGFMAVPSVEAAEEPAPLQPAPDATRKKSSRRPEGSRRKKKGKGSGRDQGNDEGMAHEESGATEDFKTSPAPAAVAAMAAGAALMLKPALAEAATKQGQGQSLPGLWEMVRQLLPDWAFSFFSTLPGMAVAALLALGAFLALRRLAHFFRAEPSTVDEVPTQTSSPTPQAQVAEAISQALETASEGTEAKPKTDIERLASVIVEVHDKVSPYFAEQGQAITLRDMLRSVDLLSALSFQKNLMPVFDILHLVLGMQFSDAAQRDEVFRMIEEVRLNRGAMVAGIEQSFRREESTESTPSHPVLRAKIQALLRQEGTLGVVSIYSALAAQEGMTLKTWAARSLRDASPEEFEGFLLQLDRQEFNSVSEWSDNEVAAWIDAHQIQAGVPWLLEALERGPGILRSHAAKALGNLGVKSPEVEAALVAALQDSYPPVRPDAAGSLQKLGYSHPGIGELEVRERERFEHPEVIHSSLAIENLGALQEISEDSQQVILRALRIESTKVVDSALNIIRKHSWKGPAVESALVALLLSKKNSDVGLKSLEYLLEIECRNEQLEASLTSWLKSRDPDRRILAAAALTRMGKAPENAEGLLREGLKSQDLQPAIWAAVGLDHLGIQDPEIGRVLRRGIVENPDAMIDAAFQLGPNRLFLAEVFNLGIAHPNISTRLATMERLLNQEAPLVELSFLLTRLQHHDPRVQRLVRQILDLHYPGWDSAVPSFNTVQQVLSEELHRSVSESTVDQQEGLQKLLGQLPKWAETEEGESAKASLRREEIRRWLTKESTSDWEVIYREVAKMQGVEWSVWQVAFLRSAEPSAVAAFLDLLGMNPVDECRWLAAHRLQIGLPRILSRLEDPDGKVREIALHSLRELDAGSPEIVEATVELLQDPFAAVRLEAVELLQRRGAEPEAVTEALLEMLVDPESDIRAKALSHLVKQGKSEAVEQTMIAGLVDPHPRVRAQAAQGLDQLGIVDETAIPALRAMLHDRDLNGVEAAVVLLRLGHSDREIDAVLAGALPHEALRGSYSKYVEKVKRVPPQSLPFFEATLRQRFWAPDHISDEQVVDLMFYWEMKDDLRKFAAQHRDNPDPQHRVRAAQILGRLGEASPADLDILLELFNAPVSDVQFLAAKTLEQVGKDSEHVRNSLRAMAESGDLEAMILFAKLAPEDPSAAQGLVKALGSGIDLVRGKALETMIELKIAGPEIQAALLECLKDSDPMIRWESAWALGELGMRAPEVEAAILALIGEVTIDVHVEAIQLLDKIRPEWDRAVAAEGRELLKLVQEELQTDVAGVPEREASVLGEGLSHLPSWTGKDSSGKPFQAKKLEELRAFIPGPEKLTMIGPTIEALRGLMAGIISNTPVYLMAVTGVGKNAMLRYLANLTGTPLYRINFGKETDEGQLYGHFEVEVFTNEQGEKKKRIVIQDGKMVEAIKNGGWCLWDEANLASEAFLVAQNDVVQQLKSGKVRIRQGGKIVEIPVHPNFRLFAAGNPEGYGGRKPTEKSFGSRWLKVAVREFRVEEQQAILHEEFADTLSAESSDHIPQVLHALKVAAGGEVVTLRTLKRVARRIAEVEEGGATLWTRDDNNQPQLTQSGMLAFAQAMETEVLDGLAGERYQNAVEALEKALARGEQKLEEYLNITPEEGEFFEEAQAYQKVVRSHQKKEVTECSAWEDLVPVVTTLKYAAKVLDSFRRGDNVLLEGPPAVSKSSIPKWIGKFLGQDVVEATGSPDHSSAEMVGMPTIDEQGNLVFQQGYILKALREGSLLILNEANLIPAEVLERLNSLLDDDKMLMVTENGAKVPVKADPNFRIIFTQNPAEMQGGRKQHSPALENKFRKIFLRDTFTKAELERIVAHELAKRLGTKVGPPPPPRGTPPAESPPPPQASAPFPLATASPAAPVIPPGMSGGLSLSASPSGPSFMMAGVKRSMATVFNRKKSDKAGREEVHPRDMAEAEKVADEATRKIQQEIEEAIQVFMREQGRSLENLGSLAAMRRVRVEIDTSGRVEIAAMDLDRGVMVVNPLAARELSPRQIAAAALHEGGHGAISRVGDGFFFEKKSRHLLANCLEDPRVNEYMTGRLPGSRGDFISLYEELFPDPQKVQTVQEEGEVEPPGDLPHEEFAKGFIDLWANGRVTERVKNPQVREALERLTPVARKIWATRPDPYHPREREVIAKQNEVYELIKKHILPDYEKFYKESLEQMKEKLKKEGGRGRPGGPPQAGSPQGGRSTIDEDDLDDEAKKMLEERAGELAERFEPKNTSPQRQREVDRARRRGQNHDPKGKPGKDNYQEKDFRPYDQKTFADLLKERAGRKKDTEAFYDKHPHRRYFDPVRKIAQEVGEILKQILKLDAEFEYQGPHISGTKLDVRRAVQSILHDELGILSEEDLKLFLRKKYPTRRSHGFVLLLDESGSMKDEKVQAAALQAMALFQYVMEQLRTDYAVAGFHDTADIHKSFDETIRGEKQQDAFLQELESSGGGGTNDLEGLKLSENLFLGRENHEKTVIVVTDGQGVEETAQYVQEMESRGITVIAIGIGPGTEKVGEVYKNFYHSRDFRDLPKTLLRILVKRLI